MIAMAALTLVACNDKKKDEPAVTTNDDNTTPASTVDFSEFTQLQGSEYYVFFLQGEAVKYLGNKVIYNFGPNDHMDEALAKNQGSRWLYTWDETFVGGTPVGPDPFDGAEGWVPMVQKAGGTWAGMGLCVGINDDNNVSKEGAADDLKALNGIKDRIKNYDEWYLALAYKNSVQGAGYEFKLIGSNIFNATTNKGEESGVGTLTVPLTATGEWVYSEVKLSKIPGLEFGEFTTNGSNILTIVAVPYIGGTQLDLGYAFIYKK